MKKIIIAVILLLIIGGGAYWYITTKKGSNGSTETSGAVAGQVVARVNGQDIGSASLQVARDRLAVDQGVDVASLDAAELAQFETVALDSLIGETLILQAVKESDKVPTEDEVDARLTEIGSQFDTNEAFEAALATNGTTKDVLRTQIARDLSVQSYLDDNLKLNEIVATEEEVQAAYETAKAADENAPSLEEARPQVEAFVVRQKQQQILSTFIQGLRAKAEVEIL